MDIAQKFLELVGIMEKLRGENGCPWDKEQTHESIRQYCIEEAYEVVEAIDQKDKKALCEELGDLLLQVVFHAQLSKDAGGFEIGDVITSINEKMVRRHPHVFQSETETGVKTAGDVVEKWAEMKKKEGRKFVLDGIPKALPSLLKATRMGEKVANVGFDWDTSAEVEVKVLEELRELKEAMNDPAKKEEEFGDLLLTLCHWGRHEGLDPETALMKTNEKFEKRFRWMEEEAQRQGKPISSFSKDALEDLWNQAKLS